MDLSIVILLLNLVVTSQAITNLQLLTADQVRVHLPITTRPSLWRPHQVLLHPVRLSRAFDFHEIRKPYETYNLDP